MAVPDTTTFSLQDVVTEVGPTTNDLVDCFADADSGKFDYRYYSTGNDLLEFRNYNGTLPLSAAPMARWFTFSQPQNACIQTTEYLIYAQDCVSCVGWTNVTYLYSTASPPTYATAAWHEREGTARWWSGTAFTSNVTCLNWVSILPSAGSNVAYTACGQSLGATKRYYTDTLVSNEILYSDAGYTTWTTITNYYYRYATTGGTNGTGIYFRVNNTTGTVSEVSSCPASTTTTTTTAGVSCSPVTLYRSSISGDNACINWSSGSPTYYIETGEFFGSVDNNNVWSTSGCIKPGAAGYYTDSDVWRYWNGSSFTSGGFCFV